jgi:hypothetical protein
MQQHVGLPFWIQHSTGIALVGYLILHSTHPHLQNPEKFGEALQLFGTRV